MLRLVLGWLLITLNCQLLFAVPSTVTLISDPAEAASAKFEAISNAQNSVYFSSYILRDDRTSRMLLAALKLAASQGIKVYVIIDGYGNKADPKVLAALVSSGVHLEFFKPRIFSGFGSYLNRMHDKLLVVDENIVFVGDRNAGAEYYNYVSDLEPGSQKAFISREVMIRGPVAKRAKVYLRSLINHKITEVPLYSDMDPVDLHKGTTLLNQAFSQIPARYLDKHENWKLNSLTAEVEFVYDEPGQKGAVPGTYEAILSAIDSARKRIVIENPYIVLTKKMENALERAVKERGVELVVLTNSVSSTDSTIVSGGWMGSRDFLVRLGADVFEIKGNPLSNKQRFKNLFRIPSSKASLHSKTMVIDDDLSVITSFNMDPRSSYKNTEVAALVRSKDFTQSLYDQIHESIISHSVQVGGQGKLYSTAQKCNALIRAAAWMIRSQL